MIRILFISVACLSFTACRTPRQFEEDQRARERTIEQQQEMARKRALAEQQQRTRLLIEDSEGQIREVAQEVQQVRTALAEKADNRDLAQIEQRLNAIERQLQEIERKQQQDREEIIEILSQKMATLMATQTATSASGRTHVVARGETLSVIAQAYRVRTDALIRANNISNPNSLRIGQKLVIP